MGLKIVLMEKIRIFDLLDIAIKKMNNKTDFLASKNKDTKEWVKYSPVYYKKYSEYVALGLMAMGLGKETKIASISNNRPEWNFLDMAIAMIGGWHVPIYPTLTQEDIEYILKDSEATLLVVSDRLLYKKLKPIVDKVENIKYFYTFDQVENAKNFNEIVDLGKKIYEHKIQELISLKSKISPDEIFTLIYTSGTTGNPKGVMLSHWNFLYQVFRFEKVIELDERHRALSFLPLCHVYERIVNYAMQYLGVSIYYAEGLHTIAENLSEVEPHVFATVPRVLERFYDKIVAKGNTLASLQKIIFFEAIKLAEKFDFEGKGLFYKAQLSLYDNLVFSQWRKAFGGKIKYIISGGACLSPRLARIFWAAGFAVREGYGLTETAPVICLNNMPPQCRFGSVGLPLGPEQQVKIAEDREILFKGPTLMKGYFKKPELTAEVIDQDGWFHTGDIGHFDKDGFLFITGRKKEIFKLSNGKYVAPAPIENLLVESKYIENSMIVGENEKFPGAIIVPNFDLLHQVANEKRLTYRDNLELIKLPEINDLIKAEILKVNQKLAQYERINTFKIVCTEWTPATGELSATLKKRRHIIYNRYSNLIKEMFK